MKNIKIIKKTIDIFILSIVLHYLFLSILIIIWYTLSKSNSSVSTLNPNFSVFWTACLKLFIANLKSYTSLFVFSLFVRFWLEVLLYRLLFKDSSLLL